MQLELRINELLTKVVSPEVTGVCNEALSKIREYKSFGLDEVSVKNVEKAVIESLMEKFSGSTEDDVVEFVSYLRLNNLGVVEALGTIKEAAAVHPTVSYAYNNIANLAKQPEWLVIESVISILSQFTWEPSFKAAHDSLKEAFTKNAEDIKLAKAVHETDNTRTSFIMSGVKADLDSFLKNKTKSNRNRLLETLSKYSFDPAIRNLYNVISETENSFVISKKTQDITVKNVYTPALLNENGTYFIVEGVGYLKNGDSVRRLTENEVESLPTYFGKINTIFNRNYVNVSEGKVTFYLHNKRVDIVDENNAPSISINGTAVSREGFTKMYMNAGIFRNAERTVMEEVVTIVENWDSICEADFVKSVYSKAYPGRRADVFRCNDRIHINRFDTAMNENMFYPDCNATQTRNMILEFMEYDLSETFNDMLPYEEQAIKQLMEKRDEYVKAITHLQERKDKLTSLEEGLSNEPQVIELIEAIDSEITNLKNEYFSLQNRINDVKSVKEGVGFEAGDEVENSKKKPR